MNSNSMTYRVNYTSLLHLGLSAIFLLVVSCSLVYFIKHEAYEAPMENNMCFTELETTKHQLEVVAKYKKNIEIMLLHTQKLHEADKNQFKSSIESCFLMAQQSFLCQSQLNDLQIRCNKARSDYERAFYELKQIKRSKKLM